MTSDSGFSLPSARTEGLIHVHLYFHLTNVEHHLHVEQVGHSPVPLVLILEREEIGN